MLPSAHTCTCMSPHAGAPTWANTPAHTRTTVSTHTRSHTRRRRQAQVRLPQRSVPTDVPTREHRSQRPPSLEPRVPAREAQLTSLGTGGAVRRLQLVLAWAPGQGLPLSGWLQEQPAQTGCSPLHPGCAVPCSPAPPCGHVLSTHPRGPRAGLLWVFPGSPPLHPGCPSAPSLLTQTLPHSKNTPCLCPRSCRWASQGSRTMRWG